MKTKNERYACELCGDEFGHGNILNGEGPKYVKIDGIETRICQFCLEELEDNRR